MWLDLWGWVKLLGLHNLLTLCGTLDEQWGMERRVVVVEEVLDEC